MMTPVTETYSQIGKVHRAMRVICWRRRLLFILQRPFASRWRRLFRWYRNRVSQAQSCVRDYK